MLPTGTAFTELLLLSALWIAAHEPGEKWVGRDEVCISYHTDLDYRLWNSIVKTLEKKGLVELYYDQSDVYAKVADYAGAKSRIERAIGADTLEVNWKQERLFTDASVPGYEEALPVPNGWMLMEAAKKPLLEPVERQSLRFPRADEAVRQASMTAFGAPVFLREKRQPISKRQSSSEGPWTKVGVIAGIIFGLLSLLIAWAPWK